MDSERVMVADDFLEETRLGSKSVFRLRIPRLRWDMRVGVTLLGSLMICAIAAPFIAPHSQTEGQLVRSLIPPAWEDGGSSEHLLGTDNLGRDVLSRIIYGARNSLIVAFAGVAFACSIGVLLATLSGFKGGWVDTLIMRWVDIQQSIPLILLALVLVGVTSPGLKNIVIVVGLVGWTGYARILRAEVLSLKTRDFIAAARVVGCSDSRIIARHIVPNLVGSITVLATLQLGGVIILEASLSFLGLGIQPPNASWGGMLADGRQYLTTAWWMAVFPGFAIMVAVLGANLIGDSLRVSFDPQKRRR